MTDPPRALSDPRLFELARSAAEFAHRFDWRTTLMEGDQETGLCIPMAFFMTEYMKHAGVPARSIEASVLIVDPENGNTAAIVAAPGEGGFAGHLVTYLPSKRVVLDVSLPTQQSQVLRAVTGSNVPHLFAGRWSHVDHVLMKGRIGRGIITYTFYPKARAWRERAWPWEWIRDVAHLAVGAPPAYDIKYLP